MNRIERLEQEWGVERYVDALGIFSRWMLGKQHPISQEQMVELRKESIDVFELFAAWMLEATE